MLNPDVGNEYQDQACQLKLTFNWEQWSDNPSARPYNDALKSDLKGYGGDGDLN